MPYKTRAVFCMVGVGLDLSAKMTKVKMREKHVKIGRNSQSLYSPTNAS